MLGGKPLPFNLFFRGRAQLSPRGGGGGGGGPNLL
eukprot:COSAG02_NODE_17693_length_986_cov_4.611048_2_plen_34_part_01